MEWLAWSVRPDLWPPGQDVWVSDTGDWLAYFGTSEDAVELHDAAALGGGDPGVAEALILAGRVSGRTVYDPSQWNWHPCKGPT